MARGDGYDLWRAERQALTPEDQRQNRGDDPHQMLGYWRIIGARTKPDYPVSIWAQPGEDVVIFQIGRKKMDTAANVVEWDEFVAGSWLKCVPVLKDDWAVALDTGFWPDDGKKSRILTAEEEAGIAGGSGGNNPPRDEALADQIKNLSEKIDATSEPATQDEANDLSGLLDRMRSLLKLAEAERVKEKEPHLQAGRDVDARWKEITGPGSVAYDEAEKRRKAFLRKEQARLDAEAAAETRRLIEAAKAEQERIRQEREDEFRKQAEASGIPEADIDRHIAETEPDLPEIAVAPVEPVRAVAGGAHGIARGLKSVTRGRIDDMKTFLTSPTMLGHAEVKALAQQLANRAAKAGIAIEGMTIVKELE